MLTIAIVARTPCSDGWTTIDVICIGSHLPTCHREMLRMPNAFDLRCPICQHDDEVEVRAECWRLLCEDGTDDGPSMEGYNWGSTSAARCCACNHEGTVADFTPVS